MTRDYEVVSLQASLLYQQQQQVVAVAAPTAAQIWRSVSNRRGEGMRVFSCAEFPLFVMSYGDHLDLPDFAAYATSYFHGGVVVLAPMFLQGAQSFILSVSSFRLIFQWLFNCGVFYRTIGCCPQERV